MTGVSGEGVTGEGGAGVGGGQEVKKKKKKKKKGGAGGGGGAEGGEEVIPDTSGPKVNPTGMCVVCKCVQQFALILQTHTSKTVERRMRMHTPGYLEMAATALLLYQQQCVTCTLLELKFWATDTTDKYATRDLNSLNRQCQRWCTACSPVL